MNYLIDSHNITNYCRTDAELELFWLFGVLVAGKNSEVQAKKLAAFLHNPITELSPFEYISHMITCGYLREQMEEHKLGQYNRIEQCFYESIYLNLRNCTVEELEAIHGVGPKTARFFLLHTRKNEHYAVLDTHILRWMREELLVPTPKNTPSGKRYFELEQIYLHYCNCNDHDPAALDLIIWSKYNKGQTT